MRQEAAGWFMQGKHLCLSVISIINFHGLSQLPTTSNDSENRKSILY